MASFDMAGFDIGTLEWPLTVRTCERLLLSIWLQSIPFQIRESEICVRIRRCRARCSALEKLLRQMSH